jgi:hypothetical protein
MQMSLIPEAKLERLSPDFKAIADFRPVCPNRLEAVSGESNEVDSRNGHAHAPDDPTALL